MTQLTLLIFLILFLGNFGCARDSEKNSRSSSQQAEKASVSNPVKLPPLPTFEKDEKGNPLSFDFTLSPKSVSNPDIIFSHFSNRELVIFYFSPKCVHCKRAFPHFQKLRGELLEQDVSSVVICVKNASEGDIRNFIRNNQVSVPVFQDHNANFSKKYGTGLIPLIIVVDQFGKFRRFKDFDANRTPNQIKRVFSEAKSHP